MNEQYLQDKEFTGKGALLPFMKRIFRYALRYPRWFWGFVASVTVVALSDAAFPLIWMHFIDGFIMPAVEQYKAAGTIAPEVWVGLWKYPTVFFLNGLLQVVAVYFFISFAGLIEEKVMFDLRHEMFDKLQQMSFSFYDKSATGWLLSRISSDAERVTRLISWGFLDVVWGTTMIVACLGAMFWYSWQLALIIALSIPILALVSVKIRMLILKYSRKARKINSEITAGFTEHINGVEVNKITSQEGRVSREFEAMSENMRHVSFKASYYTAMYVPLVILIGSAATGLVLLFGGKMALAVPAGITVGTLAAFFSYATQIFWPILDIAGFYAMAQGSLSAGERIFSLIDETPEIADRENATPFGQIEGHIKFDNVGFEYVAGKPVLHNFKLKIKAGSSVALVGATGGGKSTVINLVCRFYEPTSGSIKIDGEDYMGKTVHSLRSQLGVVLQTPHLFSGTVRENVSYGRLGATDKDIAAALRLVGADDFANRLDEEVGQGGERLATGEKQLLSFARAILANPRILIMDEATSSIDTLTEAKIQAGIDRMIEGRTALIIAHRLSTIKNCDRILVIKHGKIIEDGKHGELMQQKGYYHSLYTKQREQELVSGIGTSVGESVS